MFVLYEYGQTLLHDGKEKKKHDNGELELPAHAVFPDRFTRRSAKFGDGLSKN